MFRVKVAIIGLLGIFLICSMVTVPAQEFVDEFIHNFDRANSFQNIDSDSILYYANAAYLIAKVQQNPGLQIDALALIIKTQAKSGKYSNAILNCLKADSILSANNLIDRKHEIMMYKGLVYQNSGFVSEGLEFLFTAQKQIEESSSDDFEADLNYYIALANYDLNEIEICRNYARMAVSIEQKQKNMTGLVKNYILLANSFNNIDSIQKYLSLTEALVNTNEMDYKKVALLNSNALLFKSLGKLNKAKSSYDEAIKISRTNGYKKHLASLYNNYAYLLMAEKKSDSAIIILNEAVNLARELNNIDLEASVLDSYSDYYTTIGDSAMSYKYYKSSIKLRNRYRNKQRIEQSLFLSTVFETEKKEKEIVRKDSKLYRINAILFGVLTLFSVVLAILIYWRQKSLIRKAKIKTMEHEKKLEVANALIEGQDAERKRLAMDLHDGISPKLGVLKMSIEKFYKKNENTTGVIDSLTEISLNIRDLSHKMLPAQLESHGLVKALKNLIHILERNSTINFTLYTNVINRLNPKLEANLFYLSYEMINNAVKHSGGKEINVQLLADRSSISLSVEDDGKGFDQKKEMNGLGLKNVRQRVSYLDGKLTIDTGIDQGTAIIIEIEL